MMAMEGKGALAGRHDGQRAAEPAHAEQRPDPADARLEALAVSGVPERHVGEIDDAPRRARRGLARRGLARRGLARRGLARRGLARRGLARRGLAHHAARRRLSRRFTFLMLRRAAARWRGVRRAGRLAFLPPMVRVLSRWPRAPTRRLPSLSCWAVRPAASLRLLRARLRWFSFGL